MKPLILTLILIFLTIGTIAVAKSPYIKPDWNKVTNYSLNLSGRKINYALPGALSQDFPQIIGENANLYDSDLYGGKPFFKLAEASWDYKSRKMFFLDTLSTLVFQLSVVKTDLELTGDIRDSSIFITSIKKRLNEEREYVNNVARKQ